MNLADEMDDKQDEELQEQLERKHEITLAYKAIDEVKYFIQA